MAASGQLLDAEAHALISILTTLAGHSAHSVSSAALTTMRAAMQQQPELGPSLLACLVWHLQRVLPTEAGALAMALSPPVSPWHLCIALLHSSVHVLLCICLCAPACPAWHACATPHGFAAGPCSLSVDCRHER